MSQGKTSQSPGGRQKERKRIIEKGIVMSVPSGDRLVVYCVDNQPQGQKWTPPKKKEIKLSGIQAPSAGRRKNDKPKGKPKGKGAEKDAKGKPKAENKESPKEQSEKTKENKVAPTQTDKAKSNTPAQQKEEKAEPPQPYYWESRNFLRELTIGKVVEYEIFQSAKSTASPDQKNKSAIPREIGNVKLQGEQDSLSRVIVAAGWATVKVPKEKQDSTGPPKSVADLLAIQAEAQKAGRGIHAPKGKSQPVKFDLKTDFDHWQKYKEWKEQKLTGIVEAVINGSFLRITVAPHFHSIPLRIAGVRCPNFKKDGTSDPFGKEAQFTTERYVLNRTVQVKLSAFEQQGKKEEDDEDKQDHGTYHGEIFLNDKSIGELLLQSGLGAFVEWSCPKEKIEAYKALELQAQKARLRMWLAPDAVQKNQKPATSWMGRVKGVVSGSTLTIQNLEANPPRLETISLSSIVTPQLRRGDDDDPEPLAWEAKEFVRKRLIGKRVRVTLDYVRPELARPEHKGPADEKEGQDSEKQRGGGRGRGKGKGKNAAKRAKGKEKIPEKPFYTVEHDKRNIALALVENGLATVQQRGGDNRSPHYDALILAQDRAKQKQIGLHSKQALGKHIVNDISRDAKRAKQMFATLEGKHLDAVVEYVISGSRLKLHLPRENLMITFTLAGVRTPSIPAKNKDPKKGGKEGEAPEKEVVIPPFAVEARDFTREFCNHFDVQIEIEGQDLSGAFRGNLMRKKKNLALLLLEEGLGMPSTPGSRAFGELYAEVAAKAQEARKNIWKDYDPVKEAEELKRIEEENAASPTQSGRQVVKLLLQVTEVLDGGTFYSQIVGDEKTQLEEMMKAIAARNNAADPPIKPAAKDVVLARFSGDQAWYRAQVLNVTKQGEYHVFYGDFGNVETTDASQLRALPPEFGLDQLRWQARETKLAFIEPRRLDQEWGEKAALVFKRLVWDKELMARIEYTRNGVMHVTLWDENKLFVNGELVRKGLARVEKRPPRSAPNDLIRILREAEELAHENHKGLWEHGDPGYSDEEI